MENNPAYRDLKPGSGEHNAFIADALRTQNIDHLQALKGRAGKPIRIVSNWFYHALIFHDHPNQDVVVIHTDDQVEILKQFLNSNK